LAVLHCGESAIHATILQCNRSLCIETAQLPVKALV